MASEPNNKVTRQPTNNAEHYIYRVIPQTLINQERELERERQFTGDELDYFKRWYPVMVHREAVRGNPDVKYVRKIKACVLKLVKGQFETKA